MSLVIEVSSQSVYIAKYQLEFPFAPLPDRLAKAALETYQMLSQSPKVQSQSGREERGEVIRLLQSFGHQLYQTLIPEALRPRLPKEGALFIRAKDEKSKTLPYELLFDGASFIAQTQGVIRLFGARTLEPDQPQKLPQDRLKITLLSYRPDQARSTSPGFMLPVERLGQLAQSGQRRFSAQVDGNAEWGRTLSMIESGLDILLFTGYEDEGLWAIGGQKPEEALARLTRALEIGVRRGLRLLILASSQLLEGSSGLERYGYKGIPAVISFEGRLDTERALEYLGSLWSGLSLGQTLLQAHRHGVNQLQTSLGLSWDWSWVRLSMPKELVDHPRLDSLRAFSLTADPPPISSEPNQTALVLSGRRFAGNLEVLSQLEKALTSEGEQRIVWLRSLQGQHQEEYLLEYFRRLAPKADFSVDIFYYYRWGFHEGQQKSLLDRELADEFGFLWGDEKISEFFDFSLVSLKTGTHPGHRYLCVYFPPDLLDPLFEAWLKGRRALGWRVLLFSQYSFVTDLPTEVISTDRTSLDEIKNAFEDRLPESWDELLKTQVPPQMRNHALLSQAVASGEEPFTDLFNSPLEPEALWSQSSALVQAGLGVSAKRLLCGLYLLKVKWHKPDLELLFGPELDKDLERLFELHLVERNLEGNLYWMAGNLAILYRKYKLLPQDLLVKTGQELLQKIIGSLEALETEPSLVIAGFSQVAAEVAHLGSRETALQRNLQFAKKMAPDLGSKVGMLSQNILTSLELALETGSSQALERCFSSILSIFDHLPLEAQTLRLYQWLLQAEEERHNWPQVSALQCRLAAIHVRQGAKERAKGLLVSATQLALDLGNPAERSHILVEIALLLLEIGEMEQLQDFLGAAQFQPEYLNQETLARLWLIDGHLLYHHQEPGPARRALAKAYEYKHPFLSDSLAAQTELILAKLARKTEQMPEAEAHLREAAKLFEKAKQWERAAAIHDELVAHKESQNRPGSTIEHLEWLYRYNCKEDHLDRARKIALKLGGLYYNAGDKTRSTEYYGKAQSEAIGPNPNHTPP